MSLFENMRPGSFRGVPFQVALEAKDQTGRRAEIHRYPQRNDAYVEDLGRKTEPFTIAAMIVGADYLTRAQALYDACGADGPGDLVHPWLGSMRVLCLNCDRSYTTKEGGAARFSLTFVVYGENRYPSTVADTRIPVRDSVVSARDAIASDFGRVFSVSRRPSFIGESATGLLDRLTGWMGGGAPRLSYDGAAVPGFLRDLSSFSTDQTSLMRTPAPLAGRLVGLIATIGDLFSSLRAGVRGYQSIGGWGGTLSAVPTTTSSRLVQADNQAALASLVRRAALIEEARLSSDVDFEHYDEAIGWRDDLAGRLDDEMILAGNAGDDESYRALESLRAASVRDVTARGADLSRLAHVTAPTTRPTLALAWQFYGDDPDSIGDRAEDIARRNRLTHPGFVPGGRAIEVLTDG